MSVESVHAESEVVVVCLELKRMTLKLNQCCCGCSLRTGTAIIGVYLLTTSLLMTILASVMLGLSPHEAADEYRHYQGNRPDYSDELFPNVRRDSGYGTVLIFVIVGAVVQSGLNALLLLGVKKEKKGLLLVWLVSHTVLLGLSILMFVTSFFQAPDPIYQTATFLGIVMYVYFLLVVRSYYLSLSDGQMQQNISMVYGGEKTNIKPVPLK